jgi:uncharacterized membrane protein
MTRSCAIHDPWPISSRLAGLALVLIATFAAGNSLLTRQPVSVELAITVVLLAVVGAWILIRRRRSVGTKTDQQSLRDEVRRWRESGNQGPSDP